MTGTVSAADLARLTSDDPTAPVPRRRPQRRDAAISQVPYLPGLDGIRGLAVVAVMVYHANSDWLAGGYLGVEVFFVISGYLITLLIIAEHERTGRLDLRAFWIRRARRLLPALFTMMLLLSVWVALFERDALGKLRGDVIAGTFYGANWYQIWIGAGYSAGNDFAPLRHLWSLAVEEQFYLLWPLAMLAFVRFGARRITKVAGWLFVAVVVLTVVIALLDHGAPQQTPELTPEAYWFIGERPISKPDALYLSTITRAGGLMLGAAFAMVWRPAAIVRGPLRTKGRALDGFAGVGLAVLGILCVLVSFQPSQGVHGFLFNGGLFVTGIASLALIAAVTHPGAVTGRLLATPVLLWIGTRSYGLYLYHWPIYQIIRNIAANKLVFHEFVLAMVATAIITELSYRYIETPIRQGKLSELWHRRRDVVVPVAGNGGRGRPLTDGQRKGALIGAGVGAVLTVFAGASLATADLKQNAVAESLDEGAEATCDVATEDCFDPAVPEADPQPVVTDGLAAPSGTEAGAVPSPTTEPAPAEPAAPRRLAIGDSVMLGAAPQLGELGFVVDATESRAFVNGLDTIETLAANGELPDQLVVHLGTNGAIQPGQMDRLMIAVESVPQVLLVQNDVDFDFESDNNDLMVAAAADRANVDVLYWKGLVGDCPGNCLYDDRIHLRPDGAKYYARLIASTLGLEIPNSLQPTVELPDP